MFKLGDIVKVVKKDDGCRSNLSWTYKMNELIGTEVEIFYVRGEEDDCDSYNIFIKCEEARKQGVNGTIEKGWWFPRKCLEFVSGEKSVTHVFENCPNCKVEMQDHYSEWAKGIIKKCKCCGYC